MTQVTAGTINSLSGQCSHLSAAPGPRKGHPQHLLSCVFHTSRNKGFLKSAQYNQIPWKARGRHSRQQDDAPAWSLPALAQGRSRQRRPHSGVSQGTAGSCEAPAAGERAAAPRCGPRGLLRPAEPRSGCSEPPGRAYLRPRRHEGASPWQQAPFAPVTQSRITWRGRALKGPAGGCWRRGYRGCCAAWSPGAAPRGSGRSAPPCVAAPAGRRMAAAAAAAAAGRGSRGGGGPGRPGVPWASWEVRRAAGAVRGRAVRGHPRPAALSLFPRNAEEDDEDAIILLLKKAKVRLQGGGTSVGREPVPPGPGGCPVPGGP